MPTNAEIRTIQFMQGVEITLPASVLDDSGNKIIINNASNASTGLTFSDLSYREVIIDYSIRRRTDDTVTAGDVIIEGGQIKLTANPDAPLLANRWIKKHSEKEDEGVVSGVTFSIAVLDNLDGTTTVDLLYTSTSIAGANHDCKMSYALTSFLV